MQKHFNNVTNRSGDAEPSASVLVTLAGAAATIYSGNGSTVAANPITCDNNGYFEFYAANGRYTLAISAAGFAGQTLTDVLLYDPAEGNIFGTVNVFTKNQSVAPFALTDAATIAVDAAQSNNFAVTLGGNRTLANPTHLTAGMVLNFCIDQDGTGTRTLAFGSLYKFPGGVSTLSTAAGTKDFVSCYYDGTVLRCNLSKGYA